MIAIRQSAAARPNDKLRETTHGERQSNTQWLKAVGADEGIVLLGGSSVAHFRLRVAQSHLRRDLTPSLWSFAGLLDGDTIISVPFNLAGDASEIAAMNGVQNCRVADYDDPERFPNIAVLSFASDFGEVIAGAEMLSRQRSIIDLPALVLNWLGYLWSTGQVGNPLLAGYGVPSAVFVETVYGMTGVELTPGLSSSASCPEAIWQSAKWWHNFYEGEGGREGGGEAGGPDDLTPRGSFLLRQPAATAVGPKDQIVGRQVVRRGEGARKGGGAARRGSKAKRGGGQKSR